MTRVPFFVLAADGWGIPFLTFGALNMHDDIKNKKYNQSHSCMQIHYVIYFGKLHKTLKCTDQITGQIT